MSFDNLYFRTGDPEEDMRREERIAWCYYLRAAKTLANTPHTNAQRARAQVRAAREKFEKAWRALDEVIQ
jgi:hypothetical protein